MKPTAYFISEATLKEKSVVSANVDTKLLNQAIWDIQERCVKPVLGKELYIRLQAGINAADLSDTEKELLSDYIINMMVFYVLSELPMILNYKFHNKNILKKTAENAETMSMTEIADLVKYYLNKAEFYEQQTINFLKDTAEVNGVLKEYFESDCETPKQSGYQCQFVLDDDE